MSSLGGNLTGVVISIAVTVIVLIAIFSIVPRVVAGFDCPAIDTVNDTDDVKQWKQSCIDLKNQMTIVPILLGVIVILAVLVIVTRLLQ